MESNDRRQRQSNPTGYIPAQSLQQSSQYPPSSTSERFRPGLQPSPTSAPSRRGGGSSGYGDYNYGEGAQFTGMQTGALQYQPEYAAGSSRTQQGQQQYPQYGSNMMYAQQQSISPTSPYEPIQRYQQPQQQMAAAEVLSTQFGTPQQQYYVPAAGDAGPTSAPNSAITPQNVPSQYPPLSYTQQSPVGHPREALGSAYGAGIPDPSAQTGAAQYGSGYTGQTTSDIDAAYGQYQTELRRTNESVRDGRLAEAGNSLLRVSEWLLGNAETLVRDEESMHAERLRLWEDFNHTWLAVLQRQKDMSILSISGQQLSSSQTLIEVEFLRNMGNELVRLCDIMEKHGLVDYQMGVWEEAIMDLLVQCVDILEEGGNIAASSRRR